VGGNGGLEFFLLKMPLGMVEFFSIPPFQTTWAIFPNGHSKHCAQG
jgi:hypothetical protein